VKGVSEIVFRRRPNGERVAVGTALTSRPPHRSGRAAFPHPAPASGDNAKPHRQLDVPARVQMTRFPGAVSGMRCSRTSSPWPALFPPPSPPPLARLCSWASQVLQGRPTSRIRSSPDYVLRLSGAACGSSRWRTRDLPVPVRGACVRARGLRPRGVPSSLAITARRVLPSASLKSVGTPEWLGFTAQHPARTSSCQRFATDLAIRHA
jgi:hypothetical protein